MSTAVALIGALVALIVLVSTTSSATAAEREWTCLPGTTAADLDRLFVSEPGGVVGADYQRTTPLPDGRVLWTFQDAEVRRPDGSTLLYVFAAEMNERSPGYLVRTEPSETMMAVVDTQTLTVLRTTTAANSGTDLYGWSIESDSTWTYLFAQCHRGFGFDPYISVSAHDQSCANRVTVGRVPRGQLSAAPTYWTGRGWSADPAAAVPIIETADRMVNATQFVRSNNTWMAITKVGDWWGDRILVERAERAVGPYSVVAEIRANPRCEATRCNTYFASWIPTTVPGQLMFAMSHNQWNGLASEFYRPSFEAVPALAYTMSSAQRCSLGHCD